MPDYAPNLDAPEYYWAGQYDAQAIADSINATWASPLFALHQTRIVDIAALCSAPPPSAPVFTAVDLAQAYNPFADREAIVEKLKDFVDAGLHRTFCHAVDAPPLPPIPNNPPPEDVPIGPPPPVYAPPQFDGTDAEAMAAMARNWAASNWDFTTRDVFIGEVHNDTSTIVQLLNALNTTIGPWITMIPEIFNTVGYTIQYIETQVRDPLDFVVQKVNEILGILNAPPALPKIVYVGPQTGPYYTGTFLDMGPGVVGAKITITTIPEHVARYGVAPTLYWNLGWWATCDQNDGWQPGKRLKHTPMTVWFKPDQKLLGLELVEGASAWVELFTLVDDPGGN